MSKITLDELKEQVLLRLLKSESLDDLGDQEARHAVILELGREGSVDHGTPIKTGVLETIARIPNVRLTPRGRERAEKIAGPQSPPD